MRITLCYYWGDSDHDCEYDYECDYKWDDVYDYMFHEFGIDKDTIRSLENCGYIDFDVLEDDDNFKEYLKDKYEDDAREAAADEAEYARDPWGYYGVSIHDFI